MTKHKTKSKNGEDRFIPAMTTEEAEALIFDSEDLGFCIYCGEDAYGVEPDARRYECECCGKNGVWGIPELIIRNCVKIN